MHRYEPNVYEQPFQIPQESQCNPRTRTAHMQNGMLQMQIRFTQQMWL